MLKKTISYTDYEGNERKEDFYFNLSKAELMEMELMQTGGLKKMLEKIVSEQDAPKMMEFFKSIILKSYGEKSADGKRFIKSPEKSEEFTQTEAYSELYIELISSADAASNFIVGIIPNELQNQVMNDPSMAKYKNNK